MRWFLFMVLGLGQLARATEAGPFLDELQKQPCPAYLRGSEQNSPLRAVPLSEPHALTRRQTNRADKRGRLHQLAGQAKGTAINGKVFPDMHLVVLPETKVPVGVVHPTEPPVGRLVLLHGLGYSISTVFSLTSTAEILNKIAEGGAGDPFATWFAQNYPELRLPFQIVLMDLPPMGWAPPLAQLPTAIAMASYLEKAVAELQTLEPLRTFYVSRSASAALSLWAGRQQAGVVITGGTYPHKTVLDKNLEEIRRAENEDGETPSWDLIHEIVGRFLDPSLLNHLELVALSDLPILSLVGESDGETPWEARWRWAQLLGLDAQSARRSQHILPGARHQVFRRPQHLPGDVFTHDDPDVIAFRRLLEFLKTWK